MDNIIRLFFIGITFFGLNSISQAISVPFPATVLSIDDLVDEFRGAFSNKLVDLSKNYIVTFKGQQLVFTSHEDVHCLGQTAKARTPLATISFLSKQGVTELSEKGTYLGCHGYLTLQEEVVTRGTDLTPITFNQFVKGERIFSLLPHENYRFYSLKNGNDQQLFGLHLKRTKTGLSADFFILDEKFMNVTYRYSPGNSSAVFTFHSFHSVYKTRRSKWDWRQNYGRSWSISARVFAQPEGKIYYFDGSDQISHNSFLGKLAKAGIKPLTLIGEFVAYQNSIFPSTKFTGGLGQNQRIKNELQLAHTRLVNNRELNLVKNLMLDYLKAIEDGELVIQDNRLAE